MEQKPVAPNVGPQPAPKKYSSGALIGGILVLVILAAGGVYAYARHQSTSRAATKATSSNTATAVAGGNKADANGLVSGVLPLECVPKGHDYYRTNNTLSVDPTNSQIVYVGVELKGVYKTTDGGTTWKVSDTGVRGYPMESDATKKCLLEMGRIAIDPANPQHILLSRVESPGDLTTLFSENGGVYESLDAGATWHQLLKGGMNASGSQAIAFDPKDSKTIYYGSNNMTPSFTTGNGQKAIDKYYNTNGILYQTKDAGATWAELPTGAAHGFRALNIAVDQKDSKTLWFFTFTANTQEGAQPVEADQKPVLLSKDGGATWVSLGDRLPTGSHIIVDGMLSPQDGQNAFVIPQTNATGGVAADYVTTDGGTSWKKSSIYIYAAGYDPNDTSGRRLLGYAPYDAPGIYQSTDGGVTWTKYSALPAEVDGQALFGVRISNFAWSLTDKATVYMSGSGGTVWKSIDNGKTWKTVMTLDTIGGKNKNKEGAEKSREADTSTGGAATTSTPAPTPTATTTPTSTSGGNGSGAGTGGGGGAGTGGGGRHQ